MTADNPAARVDLDALEPEERASLLRVLDWGVESRNMPHATALHVLAIADRLAPLLAELRDAREAIQTARQFGRDRDQEAGVWQHRAETAEAARVHEPPRVTGALAEAIAERDEARAERDRLRERVEALFDGRHYGTSGRHLIAESDLADLRAALADPEAS